MTRYFILATLIGYFSGANGQSIYVSPTGRDSNPGTIDKPIQSVSKAQELTHQFPANKSVEVIFDNGTYYLPQTIQFTDRDSRNTGATTTYRAKTEGGAVLSGGTLLKLKWKPFNHGIFVAKTPKYSCIDQLFINGARQRMARFPNAVEGKNVYDTWELDHQAKSDSTQDPLIASRILTWKNPTGGYIHAMHGALWGDMHWQILGKKSPTKLDYIGGWQNNRPSGMHPTYRMVENIFEELDAPGEWYYQASEQKIYFKPDSQTDLSTAKVEVVRLRHLIEFNGTKQNPVLGIALKGFIFRHAMRTFMENKEPLLRSDWTIYRGGAVVFNGAENCSVSDCEFDQVGGNGVFINNYNRHIYITGCYLHNIGASGIAFVGDPAMVRNPIFSVGKQNFETLDHTKGPKGDNFPESCTVEDCLITLTGRDEKQTSPITISMSHKITVNHCSIYDVPRAGINISEGTFGGHVIENSDIFNTVLETGDHGSFNSWGRDRYWSPNAAETLPEVAKDPNLPFLDMLDMNVIRNNRWRCDHGWDIDLDDGSSWYQIYNNLLLNGGLKLREGYNRIATNNIIINSGLHPHVWYTDSKDVFKNNIVFKAYQPAIMNRYIAINGQWGKELDYNFYASTREVMLKYSANQCDKNSVNGDPLFVDAANGDFRVKENSPVLALGFHNFPMNQFGVVKKSLRAIAKTPEIPQIDLKPAEVVQRPVNFTWMGATIHELRGSEASAFGISFDSGGIVISQIQKSDTKLQAGDLILSINKKPIKTMQDLKDYLKKEAINNHHLVQVSRNQAKISLSIDHPLPLNVEDAP